MSQYYIGYFTEAGQEGPILSMCNQNQELPSTICCMEARTQQLIDSIEERKSCFHT